MERLHVDEAPADEARRILRACCGSTRWVERMIARRPFGTVEALLHVAREEWFTLTPDGWLEAFSQHPRIGDRGSLRERFPDSGHLAAGEQAGVAGASEDVLTSLAAANAEYEKKFGYIFIVCATGLRAEDMLARLHERLQHDPWSELRIAAEEQAKITAIRLRKI